MVFSRLQELHKKREYDFIHLSSYFDKHYQSVKRCATQSLFCFILPSFVLVVADTNERSLYAYDCVLDRSLDIHLPALRILGSFVDDYCYTYN
jgi:hypothetical protein